MEIKRATSKRLLSDCADKNSAYGPTLSGNWLLCCAKASVNLFKVPYVQQLAPPERREEEQNFATRERGHRENQFGRCLSSRRST
eukprot:4490429-Amphidinium_carterae.1